MPDIQNYDVYTARMQNSMYDKLFFVDKIFDDNIDTFIDFGCADGELMLHLYNFMPNLRYIGYDIDTTMLRKAKEKVPFAEFYDNWEDIVVDPSKTIVNLSSVIHEVYHYANDGDVEIFWHRLLTQNFAYIVVRDMFKNDLDSPVDNNWKQAVINAGYGQRLTDFEAVWGKISTTNQKMHFLLKYRYVENWEREIRENYIPISVSELKRQVGCCTSDGKYEITYQQFSSLPFIVHKIKQDFGFDVGSAPTHLKIIFALKR